MKAIRGLLNQVMMTAGCHSRLSIKLKKVMRNKIQEILKEYQAFS